MCVDIVVRLKEFMKHVGLPSTQFADCAKIARPTISQLLNGRNRKVSNELISKLHDAFPELNILWLMFGDGEMINNTVVNTSNYNAANSTAANSTQSLLTSSCDKLVSDEDSYNPVISDQSKSISIHRNDNQVFPSERESESNNELYEPHVQSTNPPAPSIQISGTANTETAKRIKSIMVFYNDSSFEIFTPSDL